MNHARFLLKLAFETSNNISQQETSHSSSNSTQLNDNSSESEADNLTFVMRYRAMRAARILCPQDVLHIIMQKELSVTVENVDVGTILNKCYYGCFMAKEIENMGLNLPSSDIISLSFMDHVSLARVLWRQYGRVEPRHKTRLLFLLLELSDSKDQSKDNEFIATVKHELKSMNASLKQL
jgi:hypothetical protein